MKEILIVDDDPNIIELVKNRLEANNYKVISACDGKEGIKKAQEYKPDLIIMDILMPQMQGGDVVKFLKVDQATKDIPIIFLTAVSSPHSQKEDAQGINVQGEFFMAIAKPLKSEELLFEIKKLIGQ